MNEFTLHTRESAPEKSKALLEKSVKTMGMIPNLHAVMAESPSTLEAYQELHRLFSQSSLSAEEKTVVWQSINVENECHYCVPAHTAIAHMMKVDDKIIDALNNRTELPTEKHEVLRSTTLSLVRHQGRLSEQETELFYSVGFKNRHLLDIVLGVSQKTLSNYVNHIAHTKVDEPFEKYAWTP